LCVLKRVVALDIFPSWSGASFRSDAKKQPLVN
jgi:hypothetical protein